MCLPISRQWLSFAVSSTLSRQSSGSCSPSAAFPEAIGLHSPAREQLKVYQDRGIVVVVVDLKDLESVATGQNLISLLRSRYESVRLDIR